MSLKAFHVFFMVVSTLFLAGFAAWCFVEARAPGASPALPGMGGASAAGALGLPFYARSFLRKTKNVSWL